MPGRVSVRPRTSTRRRMFARRIACARLETRRILDCLLLGGRTAHAAATTPNRGTR